MKTKQQRRDEAAAREATRAKRSDEEQLAHLDAKGWDAARERARLHARIAARAEAEATAKVEKKATKGRVKASK